MVQGGLWSGTYDNFSAQSMIEVIGEERMEHAQWVSMGTLIIKKAYQGDSEGFKYASAQSGGQIDISKVGFIAQTVQRGHHGADYAMGAAIEPMEGSRPTYWTSNLEDLRARKRSSVCDIETVRGHYSMRGIREVGRAHKMIN